MSYRDAAIRQAAWPHHPDLFKLETNPVPNEDAPGMFGVPGIVIFRRFCQSFTHLYDTNPQITALCARFFLGLNGPPKGYLHFTGIFHRL